MQAHAVFVGVRTVEPVRLAIPGDKCKIFPNLLMPVAPHPVDPGVERPRPQGGMPALWEIPVGVGSVR